MWFQSVSILAQVRGVLQSFCWLVFCIVPVSATMADTNIFIRDIPIEVDENTLKTVFGAYGTVVYGKILPSKGTTQAAIIEFQNADEAKWIVENVNGNMPEGISAPLQIAFKTAGKGKGGKGKGKGADGGGCGCGGMMGCGGCSGGGCGGGNMMGGCGNMMGGCGGGGCGGGNMMGGCGGGGCGGGGCDGGGGGCGGGGCGGGNMMGGFDGGGCGGGG